MNKTVLLGRGRQIVRIPRATWEEHLARAPEHSKTRLAFMSPEHHRVRRWVVAELPRAGTPLPPERISDRLEIPLARIHAILDDLERKLFFLVRNGQGTVSWAYPVTVDPTPHRLLFSTGERAYAA